MYSNYPYLYKSVGNYCFVLRVLVDVVFSHGKCQNIRLRRYFKMKKRNILVGLLVGTMVIGSLTGCGSGKKEATTEATTTESSTEGNSTEAGAEEGSEENSEGASEESSETNSESDDSGLDENGVYLGDYSNFTYTREYTAPTDQDVEETINDVLESNETREYKEEGTVADGDTVVVSFTGSVDGKVMDGLSGEQEELTIGDGTFIADFENALVGHKVGETFNVDVEFPEDYSEEDVAGKTATMSVVVNSIAGPVQKVELTDEWVKDNTDYDTVEDYKAGIMDTLEKQAEEMADSSAIYSLINDLYNVSYAEVSDEEIDAEANKTIDQYKQDAEDMDMTYEDYVKQLQGYDASTDTEEASESESTEAASEVESESESTETGSEVESESETSTEVETETSTAVDPVESFEQSIRNAARDTIEQEKIIAAFAEKESVDLSDDAFDAYLERQASLYGYESKDEFKEELDAVGYSDYIQNIFKEYQVGKKLMEISKLVTLDVVEAETDTEAISEDGTEAETDVSTDDTEVTTEVASEEDTTASDEDVSLSVGDEVSLEETEEVTE